MLFQGVPEMHMLVLPALVAMEDKAGYIRKLIKGACQYPVDPGKCRMQRQVALPKEEAEF